MISPRSYPPITHHQSLITSQAPARLEHLGHVPRRDHNHTGFGLKIDRFLQSRAGYVELFLTALRPAARGLRRSGDNRPISTVKTKRSICADRLKSECSAKRLTLHRNFVDTRYLISLTRPQAWLDSQGASFHLVFARGSRPTDKD